MEKDTAAITTKINKEIEMAGHNMIPQKSIFTNIFRQIQNLTTSRWVVGNMNILSGT